MKILYNVRFIGLLGLAVLVLPWATRADDITLATWGDLTAGGQYDIKMICRKDTSVTNTIALEKRLKEPENWYVEKENELYRLYHNQNNTKVYFMGSTLASQVNANPVLDPAKKISNFVADPKAAPAECRLYFIVRY